jgi:DNA-binding CsgD family transcriptional regulator
MSVVQQSGIISVEKENLIQTVVNHISSYCREDKNLMISVFDIKKNKFLFCNDSFKNILGYNADEIISGGWEFWYKKINPVEARVIKHAINLLTQKPLSEKHPGVLSFTYHIKDIFSNWYFVSHELSLYHFKKNLLILSYLYDISQIERIEYFLGKKQHSITNKSGNKITVSKREKEVLVLIAEGFSSKQIADELYISNHTAIKHRKNLIEKFKVKNTAQLIKEASRFFLL